MIVEIVTGTQERPEVRVVDVDNLTALHLALGEVTDEEAGQALAAAGLGRLQDADTGFLDVAALKAAARPSATAADWDAGFDGMVGYAASKGWVGADGALQVHIESAAGG